VKRAAGQPAVHIGPWENDLDVVFRIESPGPAFGAFVWRFIEASRNVLDDPRSKIVPDGQPRL